VGVTLSLVAHQENYRLQLVNLQVKHQEEMDTQKTAYGVLESKYNTLSDERERLAKENGELTGHVATLRDQASEAQAVVRVQQNIIQDQEAEIKRLDAQVDSYRTNFIDKSKENERLETKIAQLDDTIGKLTVARDGFQDRLTAAEKTRDNAIQEVAKLTEDVNHYVRILQRIKTDRPDVYDQAVRGETIEPRRAIRGKVTAVDKNLGLVVINVGQKNDVRKGYSFIVFRGNQYVGKVVVDEVFPDVAAAQYSRPDMRTDVEVGDDVTTKLVVDH
jgi:chromosome segregation ATPase